ncbi:MAG: hypothetical protein E4H35_09380, partial [Candidatus Aminicenantes bacterium]
MTQKKILSLILIMVAAGGTAVLSAGDGGGPSARPAISAPEKDLEYVSSILWSKAYDMVVDGSYGYCAFLNGLAVLDLAGGRSPAFVSQLYLGGGFDIAKAGSFVYIAAGKAGLKIVDVSNPRSPVLKGEAVTSGIAKAVAVAG